MRSGKILIYIAWIIAAIFLGILTMYSQTKVDSFLGLTESQETNMNYPFPVQIKKIYVNLGQEVKKGEKLAEVVRLDIDTELSTLKYKIAELVSKKALKHEKLQSELETLKIKKNKDLSEIEFQLRALKQKTKLNQQLLQSIDARSVNSNTTLAQMKIQTLKKKKNEQQKLYDAKISNILSVLQNKNSPIAAQIKQLENKINILKKESAIITISAPYDADIGTINKTEGESLKSFTPIINLHPLYPTYVTGYIHESIQTELKIGQKVIVKPLTSLSNEKVPVKGELQSISTRIVNFPTRLKKFKIVPLWGYKVLIKIPKSDLKLGQKVTVSKELNPKDDIGSKIFNFLHSIKLH